MKNLKNLIDFLKKDFDKELSEVNSSLELVVETLEKVKLSINSSIPELNAEEQFSKAKNYIDNLEKISNVTNELNELLDEISLKRKKKNNSIPDYSQYRIDNKKVHSLREDFEHKRPYAFVLNGEGKEVNSWTKMLTETCKFLIEKDIKLFLSFIDDDDFKGKKREYFSFQEEQMRSPKSIKCNNKEVFVETNINSNGLVKIIRKMLKKYKIAEDDYKIYLRADYNELHN